MFAIAFSFFGGSLALADEEPTKRTFNIEVQPATTSLTLYARQAQVQLGFAADLVADVLTNAVKGEYESTQALELLLEGTGLEAEQGESGIIVRRVPEPAMTIANEEAVEEVASTDSLQLAQRAGATRVPSQEPSSSSADASDEEYEKAINSREEIVVTGSRIRGAQNAAPVVTITRQEIDQAGFATVEDLVENLPQNFGAGATLDTSTDVLNNAQAVGANVENLAGGTSVNLRGLGSSSTLILLNGRRMSPSGRSARFTNISSIPITAIARVEVLTDGASAIYGSDAIGGVINFILRDDYEGAQSRLRYGTDDGGDTSSILFGQTFGQSWRDGSLLFTYEYYDTGNLANSDRDITSSNDLSGFGGTDRRTFGGNPANIVAGGQTFAIPEGQDGTSLTPADFEINAPLNFYNARSLGDVLPAQERHSSFLHLAHATGAVEWFADARFSTLDTRTRGNAPVRDITVTDVNPFFVDPTGTGLTTVTVDNYSFNGDLGAAEGFGTIDALGAALGMRFDIGKSWNGEFVGSWSKEEAISGNEAPLDDDALAEAVNHADAALAFNPFGAGSNTNDRVLQSLVSSRAFHNESENELWVFGLHADGEAFKLPGGIAQIASGVEFRRETLVSNELREPRRRFNLGRDVRAAYAEVFLPFISNSNSRSGLQRLELSLAGRYEDYSDFGSSIDPKVGLVWSPTPSLSLRGTYGTSFRAPALFDLDVSTAVAAYMPDIFVPALIPFPLIVQVGGSDELQAEEATIWTTGFEWMPQYLAGLSAELTYFSIDFEDQVAAPTGSPVLATSDPRFSSVFNTSPTPQQIASIVNDPRFDETQFGGTVSAADILSGLAPVGGILDLRKNNLSQSVVAGVDLQLSYQVESVVGWFDVGLNGSYLTDYQRRFIAADPLVEEVDTLRRPVDLRARGHATWRRQGWSLSTFLNYLDGYTDNVSDPARSIDSWTTIDMSLSYSTRDTAIDGLLEDTWLSLSVQNVLDEDPPFVDTIGGLGYDSANGNPLGRFLALQITKDW